MEQRKYSFFDRFLWFCFIASLLMLFILSILPTLFAFFGYEDICINTEKTSVAVFENCEVIAVAYKNGVYDIDYIDENGYQKHVRIVQLIGDKMNIKVNDELPNTISKYEVTITEYHERRIKECWKWFYNIFNKYIHFDSEYTKVRTEINYEYEGAPIFETTEEYIYVRHGLS